MLLILRLGHRRKRDARLSTHCGLVARAFGADRIIFSGERDEKLLGSVNNVAERWGGHFRAEYSENWRKIIRNYKKRKFTIVHLSMYGISFRKKIRKTRKSKNLLIIIGSEKVPGEVYGLSDFNISVTQQPHSEAAALAIFLHALGREKKFRKAKITIIPQERGKKVVEK